MGGKLVRELIGNLRGVGLQLPLAPGLTSDILIACSAGADSVALAILLARYGRRVVPAERLALLHVNHGWRGAESDGDEELVRALARELGVGVTVLDARRGPGAKRGSSPEDAARAVRRAFFEEQAKQRGAMVITAHHMDDLAETVLWRVLTGAAGTHGGGIAARHGHVVRPFLTVRREELREFLREERAAWREDRTNHEGGLMRTRLRREVLPPLTALFPKAVEHLAALGLGAQKRAPKGEVGELLFAASGLRARSAHWRSLRSLGESWEGELHLPEGWRLSCDRAGGERWILERKRPENKAKTPH